MNGVTSVADLNALNITVDLSFKMLAMHNKRSGDTSGE